MLYFLNGKETLDFFSILCTAKLIEIDFDSHYYISCAMNSNVGEYSEIYFLILVCIYANINYQVFTFRLKRKS